MGLREEALAAAAAATAARVETARAVLTSTLGTETVAAAEVVADVPGDKVVVFCADDDVCLAVRDEGVPGARVSLVRDSSGWTFVGEVTSLAGLGLLLATQEG